MKKPSKKALIICVATLVVMVECVILAKVFGLKVDFSLDNAYTQRKALEAKCPLDTFDTRLDDFLKTPLESPLYKPLDTRFTTTLDAQSVDEKNACIKLGKFYEKKDSQKAIKYYKMAAMTEVGTHSKEPFLNEAYLRLGNLLVEKEDYIRAVNAYALGCELRSADACHKLAQFAPKSSFEPFTLFRAVCRYENGFVPACFEYEKMNADANRDLIGTAKEFDKMCIWEKFLSACLERDKTINKAIEEKINKGYQVEDRLYLMQSFDDFCTLTKLKTACETTKRLILEAQNECEKGTQKGEVCIDIVEFYGTQRNLYEDKRYIKPFKDAAQRACDLGNPQGCYKLADYFYSHNDNKDLKLAREYGKMACETLKGIHQCVSLAKLEEDIEDKEQAKTLLYYLKTGCDLGGANACKTLAERYDRGLDRWSEHRLDKELINHKQALHYYNKACELGEACVRLGQIYLWGEDVGDKRTKPNLKKSRWCFAKDCEFTCKADCTQDGVLNEACKQKCQDNIDGYTSCYIKSRSLKDLENLDESIFN